ncbi:MAG: hypothetical protein QM723_31755 [Myxococcaceae bacterium]
MRKITLAVSLFAVTAWAQDAQVKAEAEPETPRHALWLHTGAESPLTGAALAYEHWFNRSVSVQLGLGASYSHQVPQVAALVGGVTLLGGLSGSVNDTWAMNTEVQLRWHLPLGVFFAESVGLQFQRSVTVFDSPELTGRSSLDSARGIESVLAGWGHRFDSGLAVELFAGPSASLGFSGGSAFTMSANNLTFAFRYGLGLGYAF